MVFLAHIETGSTGNLARKLGSGEFWLNYRLKRLGQTDEMLALGLKLLFLANLLKGGYVPFCRLASLLSFRWLLQKSIPVNL